MQIEEVKDARLIPVVVSLARAIWTEHYTPIIGAAQVDYMLMKFQSVDALEKQLREGYRYFLLKYQDGYVGYIGIIPEKATSSMCLSKFYISKSVRGKGFARESVVFIEEICRADKIKTIWLTVNKNNPSISIYEKLGFRKKADIVTDIGNGFVMDDFRMEKQVDL